MSGGEIYLFIFGENQVQIDLIQNVISKERFPQKSNKKIILLVLFGWKSSRFSQTNSKKAIWRTLLIKWWTGLNMLLAS